MGSCKDFSLLLGSLMSIPNSTSGSLPAWPVSLLLPLFRCAGKAAGGPLMSNARPQKPPQQ
jgi:hypothetical protein